MKDVDKNKWAFEEVMAGKNFRVTKGAVYDGKVRKEESSNLYKYYEGRRV